MRYGSGRGVRRNKSPVASVNNASTRRRTSGGSRSGVSESESAKLRNAAADRARAEAELRTAAKASQRESEILAEKQRRELELKKKIIEKQKESAKKKAQLEAAELDAQADADLLNLELQQLNESAAAELQSQQLLSEAQIRQQGAVAAEEALRSDYDSSSERDSIPSCEKEATVGEKVTGYLFSNSLYQESLNNNVETLRGDPDEQSTSGTNKTSLPAKNLSDPLNFQTPPDPHDLPNPSNSQLPSSISSDQNRLPLNNPLVTTQSHPTPIVSTSQSANNPLDGQANNTGSGSNLPNNPNVSQPNPAATGASHSNPSSLPHVTSQPPNPPLHQSTPFQNMSSIPQSYPFPYPFNTPHPWANLFPTPPYHNQGGNQANIGVMNPSGGGGGSGPGGDGPGGGGGSGPSGSGPGEGSGPPGGGGEGPGLPGSGLGGEGNSRGGGRSNNTTFAGEELSRIAEIVTLDRIGILEEDRFDGSPESNYFLFIMQFRYLTAAINDPSTKLAFLRRYVKGTAKTAIMSTLYRQDSDPEGALTESLNILEKRFGKTSRLVEKQIEKLVNGKACDKEVDDSLYGLVEELRHAKAATELVPGGLTELKSPQVLKKIIVKRCPFLKLEWMKRSSERIERGFDVDVEFFMSFLEWQANMYNSPFGYATYASWEDGTRSKEKDKSHDKGKKNDKFDKRKPGKNSNPATRHGAGAAETNKEKLKESQSQKTKNSTPAQADEADVKCPGCKESHLLYKCPGFKKKSAESRLQFITELKLCEVCFSSVHSTSECTSPYLCRLCNGQEKHSIYLHNALVQKSNNGCIYAAPIDARKAGSRPVVTVYIKNPLTGKVTPKLAMLDCGSDDIWCEDETCKLLGTPTSREKLTVSVLGKTVTKEWPITTFDISNKDGTFTLSNVCNCCKTSASAILCDS